MTSNAQMQRPRAPADWELSHIVLIIFSQPGETTWHGNIPERLPPTSSV
jgi:hypothetical protein